MPISLDSHTVSLTKNGYQKLWLLIRDYPRNQILAHLGEQFPSPNQYWALTIKMLGGNYPSEDLPPVWDKVKEYGPETIKALLAVSIVFSHKDLIKLFYDRTSPNGTGTIKRVNLSKNASNEKAYTNFAYAFDELGLAVDFTPMAISFEYSWKPVYDKPGIGLLIREVLEAQLRRTGWEHPHGTSMFGSTFFDESRQLGFHQVLGLSASTFETWLQVGDLKIPAPTPQAKLVIKATAVPPGRLMTKTSSKADAADEPPLARDWLFGAFFADLDAALRVGGLRFDASLQKRFVAGLLTKRFLILTGLSGSGKTKLALAFAKWICVDVSQIAIIPVGADWTSREPLLGYPNALKPGHYCRPDNGALDLVLEAGKGGNKHKPYFLILDEMNLSHVERYFADFLSAMESGERIPLRADSPDWSDDTPLSVTLPANLFIIGTVNIDETTYMFSPKVLDRANTIEFKVGSEAMSAFLLEPAVLQLDKLVGSGENYAAGFAQVALEKAPSPANAATLRQTLMEFFDELSPVGTEFGFRTATEILRFVGIMERFSTEGVEGIDHDGMLDAAILQKLLPKIHGSRLKVEPTLKALAGLCTKGKTKLDDLVTSGWERKKEKGDLFRFPLTFDKIANMGRRLVLNGFTSYAEA